MHTFHALNMRAECEVSESRLSVQLMFSLHQTKSPNRNIFLRLSSSQQSIWSKPYGLRNGRIFKTCAITWRSVSSISETKVLNKIKGAVEIKMCSSPRDVVTKSSGLYDGTLADGTLRLTSTHTHAGLLWSCTGRCKLRYSSFHDSQQINAKQRNKGGWKWQKSISVCWCTRVSWHNTGTDVFVGENSSS